MQQQDNIAAPASPLALLAAVLLPPLALFLVRGITPAFWVSVALTVLGFVPGAVFVLLCLLIPRHVPIR